MISPDQPLSTNPTENHAAPRISVIIPALNEERMIGRCLEHLAAQDVPLELVEVFVVDNGSRDRTKEIARNFSSRLNLQVLEMKNARIGALRNMGARFARGEYLAFLDADCLAPVSWLRQALSIFPTQPTGLIGAPYSIPEDSSWVARAWHGHQKSKLGDVSYIPGGDLLVRKSDFQQVGGFDESLQTNEDYEFCSRAIRAGLTVRTFAAISVCHLGTPQTLLEFYRKQRWHGKHVFKVFFRSLPRLRNLSSVAFAAYFLVCMAGWIGGAVAALLAGNPAYLLFFTAALLVAPFVLSLRSSLQRANLSNLVPLAMLFLTFGFARAACLVGLGAERAARAPIPVPVVNGDSRTS